MLQKLNKKNKGFTLVEIMIVVAIIALLSAIAVPNFLRARERSQATRILEELRTIEGAKDQFALETNLKKGDPVAWDDLKQYFKPGTNLANQATPLDLVGGTITLGNVGFAPTVDSATKTAFADSVGADFWGHYDPSFGGTTTTTTSTGNP